jgi:hypothetical protein
VRRYTVESTEVGNRRRPIAVVRVKKPDLDEATAGTWMAREGNDSRYGIIVSANTTDDLREIAYAILDGAAKIDKGDLT